MSSTTEQKDSYKRFKQKYLYIFFSGVILHMIFAGENTFINYFNNTSSNLGERTLSGLLVGLYGTFAYAATGMIFALLFLTPIVYFMSAKHKRNIYKSAAYAICIGVVFRIISYFI